MPMPGPNANWTAGLSVHYSQDSSLIYWFNGTQAVQVPLGGTAGLGSGPQNSLSDHFTLSFWMKHGVTPNKGKKEEETIVCNTVQNGEPSPGHWSESEADSSERGRGGSGRSLGRGGHTHHRVSAVPVLSSCHGHSPWPHGSSVALWWPECSREVHHRSPGGYQGTKPGSLRLVHIQSFCSSLHGGQGEGSGERGRQSLLSILPLSCPLTPLGRQPR